MPIRRMEEKVIDNNIIISDYAHHPTEIKCLLNAVKQKYPNNKIVVIFQPHTYSRTIALEKEFKNCFSDANTVYIDKTFTSKREKYNEEKEKQVKLIFNKFLEFNEEAINDLKRESHIVIMFIGAGDVNRYIKNF